MRRLDLLPLAPFYPTASELHRAAECVAPWALGLPEAEEAPGEWAEFGRRMHEAAERLPKPFTLPAEFLRRFAQHSTDELSRPPSKPIAPTLAAVGTSLASSKASLGVLAFLTTRRSSYNASQGASSRLVSGTVDLAYVRADGVLVVVDWKFGPREHINGEPAQDSCQGFSWRLRCARRFEIRCSSPSWLARFERRMVREDGIEVDGHDITQGELTRGQNACGFGAAY